MGNTYFTEEIVSSDQTSHVSATESGNRLQLIFKKIFRFISFSDIPIKTKFTLFSIGVLFWFAMMFAVNLTTNILIKNSLDDVTKRIVPADRVAQKVTRKIQGLIIDASLFTTESKKDILQPLFNKSEARIRDLQELIRILQHGGKAVDISRENNLFVDSIEVRQLINAPEAVSHIQELSPLLEKIKSNLNKIMRIRLGTASLAQANSAELAPLTTEYTKQLSDAYSISMRFPSLFARYYVDSSAKIEKGTSITLYTVFGIMMIATFLLLVFTITISKSIAAPVRSMMEQISSIAAGNIDLSKKIPVMSKDEIGILTADFNYLTKEIYDIVTFKKVIEEDDSLEDVYARLGKSFREKCQLVEFQIYEIDGGHGKMKPVYPIVLRDKEIFCNVDILDNCELCKVKKTGHAISSVSYPEICKQFKPELNKVHLCIPMIVGGKTGGVVQFLFSSDDEAMENARKLFKAEQYIKESLSVIEAKRLMHTLKESALKDPLTGLYNRRFLQEYTETLVGAALRRKKAVGLLMCDIDFFKQVNDLHGHNVGDSVLKETAEIIKNCVRASDLVIRFGGEEFLVLLLDLNEGEAVHIAEKIRETIEKTKIKIPDGNINKTISLGISEFPKDAESFWQAIKFADVALYKAKEGGRNMAVRFTKDMWGEKGF